MPGIAQVWLTHKEIEALLAAAPSTRSRVTDDVWRDLELKLQQAYVGIACPVPTAREETS